MLNNAQVETSKSVLGDSTVEMLLQCHQDALWTLENLGVGCKQPEMQQAFKKLEAEGLAAIYEDRIYLMGDLVKNCLKTVPGVKEFFVPMKSFFHRRYRPVRL
jgi:trimethylamine--corrinoid protein Co-methyltransferase